MISQVHNSGVFKIDDTDFGIGKVDLKIDNGVIVSLTIVGDDKIHKSITAEENGKWYWTLHPPKIYFREIPFNQSNDRIEIEITEELLDEYDIALYLMEHYDLNGTLIVSDSHIMIYGKIDICGKTHAIEIMTEYA